MDKDLEKRIVALEKWKADRERQQIVFPLDVQSISVLSEYFMRLIGTIITTGGVGGSTLIQFIGNQGNIDQNIYGTNEFVVSQNPYYGYTVNASSDIFTLARGSFENDLQIYPATSDTVPGGLTDGVAVFVINSTGTTFQVSASQGGAAINITSSGTGRQYFYFF